MIPRRAERNTAGASLHAALVVGAAVAGGARVVIFSKMVRDPYEHPRTRALINHTLDEVLAEQG